MSVSSSCHRFFSSYLWTFFLTLSLCLIAGCGGGTTGTGDTDGIRVYGSVLNSDGTPRPEAQVTYLATGKSARTDAEGRFEMTTPLGSTNPQLLIETGGIEKVVDLGTVPADAAGIAALVSVDEVAGIISLVSVEIEGAAAAAAPAPKASSTDSNQPQQHASDSAAATWQVVGNTVNGSGAPVAGVQLVFNPGGARAVSAADGAFRVNMSAGGEVLRVAVEYDGMHGSTSISGIPQGRSLTIRMRIVLAADPAQVDPNDPHAPEPGALAVRVENVQYS